MDLMIHTHTENQSHRTRVSRCHIITSFLFALCVAYSRDDPHLNTFCFPINERDSFHKVNRIHVTFFWEREICILEVEKKNIICWR